MFLKFDKYYFSLKRYPLLLFIFALASIVCFSYCAQEKIKTVVLVDKPERVNEQVTELIQKRLIDYDTLNTLVIADDSLFATKLIIEFYKANKFNVIWSDKGRHSKQSDSLFFLIKNSDEYGLIANEYHFDKIDSLFKIEKDHATGKFDAVKISEADMLLTDAFFTFALHVSKGRLRADSLVREWKFSQLNLLHSFERENHTNLVDILKNAVEQNTIRLSIDSLEPQNRQYKALKLALKNFKYEFRFNNWDSLATQESDPITFKERLKKRLIASHDYFEIMEDSDSLKLVKAIKNFQCRHFLNQDGWVGKLTFKALQRTKQDYIHQIEMNMERWRYYYEPYEKQFIYVNIPKYELRVTEKDTLVMKSKVIVGEVDHPTPVLKSTIRYFLLYPYWRVPYSIATKEILPILKYDTSYLRKQNFDVLNRQNIVIDTAINWNKYTNDYFPWKLRQRIGDDNSLGILKFNFNNKYGVYLHDTNAHRLFNREMRALSHGCVRLEKFIALAKFLIRDDSINYPLDSLKMDFLREEQKYIYIKRPIPIYINYFTAEVDKNNELFFFIDVYKRDEKMLKGIGK